MKKANQQTGEASREESLLLGSFFYMDGNDRTPDNRNRINPREKDVSTKTEADVTSPDTTEANVTPPDTTEANVTSPDTTEANVTSPDTTEAGVTSSDKTEAYLESTDKCSRKKKGKVSDLDVNELGHKLRNLWRKPHRSSGNTSAKSDPCPTARSETKHIGSVEYNKYRVYYLLLRMEQQKEHVQRIRKQMHIDNKLPSQLNEMVNIYNGLTDMTDYLLSVRDNKQVATEIFGTPDEMEEFLQAMEELCDAVEKLPVDGADDTSGIHDMVKAVWIRNQNPGDLRRCRAADDLQTLLANEMSDPQTGRSQEENRTNQTVDTTIGTTDCKITGTRKTWTNPTQSKSAIQFGIDRLSDSVSTSPNHVRTSIGTKSRVINRRRARYQPDKFIIEFDKLLDECSALF